MRARIGLMSRLAISRWAAKSPRLFSMFLRARASEGFARPIITTCFPAMANTCAMP